MTEKILLALTILVLATASLWQISANPATWFDEGINLGIAKSLVSNGTYSLQIAPDKFVENRSFLITTNYPVLFPIATSIKLFGLTLASARIPMVIFMWAFALTIFILTKRIYGQENAIMTLALIVSFAPFYGNGKAVLGEIPGLLYFILGLLLLFPVNHSGPDALIGVNSGRNPSRLRLFFSGLLFGLSASTKPFFLIIFPAIIVGEIYDLSFQRRLESNTNKIFIKRWLIIACGAIIPILAWLYSILPTFSLSAITTTLNYYANSYATTGFTTLVGQNILRFFTETTPAHFLLLITATLLAFYLRIYSSPSFQRRLESITSTEIILLTFIALNILWYLKTPGWYRYFFTAHILAFIFFPSALKTIFEQYKVLRCPYIAFEPKKLTLTIVLALFMLQTNILISKRTDPLYYSNDAEATAIFLNNTLKPNENILVINAPSIAFLLNTQNIYQYLQINPSLAFGTHSLKNGTGAPYNFIVAHSLEGVDIPEAQKTLDLKYTQTQFGQYSLYKLK